MLRAPAPLAGPRGFTLLELMIVVAILAIIASIGVPQYASALRIARVSKAKQELVTISHAVDMYTGNNGGRLPLTLHQVGFGGKRDPWGIPYCYFNYGDGTGDGLDWAVSAGLVDPSAVVTNDSGGGSSGGGAGGMSASGGGVSGGRAVWRGAVGWGAGTGRLGPVRDAATSRRPQGAIAVAGVETVEAAKDLADRLVRTLSRDIVPGETEALAISLTNTTTKTIFTGVVAETVRRRDRYMFPLNTDYDLFSLGPNGRTAVSLGETVGQDDVIRANNGGFFGTASDY